jgi:hypothetical protein
MHVYDKVVLSVHSFLMGVFEFIEFYSSSPSITEFEVKNFDCIKCVEIKIYFSFTKQKIGTVCLYIFSL